MKVLCQREQLREGLAVVTGVIPLKSTRPAIENVCLVVTDDALELVGTDLEVAIRFRLDEDVKVEEPGTTLIPARVIAEFVRDLSGETVSLETVDERCLVKSGLDHCELVTQDADEFPVVPRFDDSDSMPIQGGTFTRLVNRTAFAAAREPGRYAMHGILALIEEGNLRMVATDGRRLAVASSPIDNDKNLPRRAIVPTKGMQLFGKVIDDPLEMVHVSFSEAQVGMRTRRAEMFARQIDGEFPRYATVIPSSSSNNCEADAETLLKKLRLVSNVTAADTRAVRLSFTQNQMGIRARSAACGEANAQLEVKYTGEEADIAFNPDYLMEGLKNCERDVVQLDFNERTAPGKFTLGENYIYVVMPITIDP